MLRLRRGTCQHEHTQLAQVTSVLASPACHLSSILDTLRHVLSPLGGYRAEVLLLVVHRSLGFSHVTEISTSSDFAFKAVEVSISWWRLSSTKRGFATREECSVINDILCAEFQSGRSVPSTDAGSAVYPMKLSPLYQHCSLGHSLVMTP